jgi:MFS family permease
MTSGSVLLLALVVAAAGALRSTWSPCGLSMLSSITPMAERARGRRFGSTAAWFVLGGALGGATLGLAAAPVAALVGWLAPPPAVVGLAAALAALAAAAVDLGLVAPALPHHRRQVNELWLNRYRGWVYGVGFGWQIGTGVGTYIMTTAVYLVAVLGALTGSPAAAVGATTLFGVLRGLAILSASGATGPAALARLHRAMESAAEPVRRVVAAVLGVVAVVAATATAGPPAGLAVAALLVVPLVVTAGRPQPAFGAGR